MDAKIIDGKKIAKKHEQNLKIRLNNLLVKLKTIKPTVVSFCNIEDPPSVKYTFMKLTKAREVGIDFIAEEFSTNTPKSYLMEMVQKYVGDPNIDGIMVQLPLPPDLNIFKEDLLNLISPEKDVDGLTRQGKFLPATVKAVLTILDEKIPGWKKKLLAVIGSQGEVGKPLSIFLEKEKVKLLKIDKYEGDLLSDAKKADIIVSATGQKGLIKPEMIKDGSVLIDVGLGDFDPGCYGKAAQYTPVTGGVGPLTVVSLMENVVSSFEERIKVLIPLFS